MANTWSCGTCPLEYVHMSCVHVYDTCIYMWCILNDECVCYKCEKVSQENGIETNCDSQLVTITDMFNTFRVLTSG